MSTINEELMIEHIELENFRGFQKLNLKELRKINIIVGNNASGKTAFLESIYLTSGGPGITFKLKAWRGLGERFEFPLDETQLGNFWRDLFYRFEPNSLASISLRGSNCRALPCGGKNHSVRQFLFSSKSFH